MQKRNLNLDLVIDLCIDTNEVIYIKRPGEIEVIELSPVEFMRFKFDLIKHVKQSKNPSDRFIPYEVRDKGVYSLDKHLRLEEARKTRAEKLEEQKDINETEEYFDDTDRGAIFRKRY